MLDCTESSRLSTTLLNGNMSIQKQQIKNVVANRKEPIA